MKTEALSNSIPTLVFHSVRRHEESDLFTLDPAHFSDIVSFIVERFGTVDIRSVKDNAGGVLLTFDDGYKDNFEVVLPILNDHNVKALFFLLPNYLGNYNLWNTKASVMIPHLSKDEVATLIQQGHTVGSHGLTHHNLKKFADPDVLLELQESRRMIEDWFHISVDCFAYPYGSTDPRIQNIARKVYRLSFSTDQASSQWSGETDVDIRREFVWPHQTVQDIEDLIVHFGTYDNNPYK